MIHVSIIGATGYVGLELTRLLSQHPEVRLVHLSSHSYQGQQMEDLYPSLKGVLQHTLCGLDVEAIARDSDVVFTSLPHGTSGEVIPQLYDLGARVIDMSGDFRYDDVEVYNKWYGVEHPRPDVNAQSVYGLPELYRERIQEAQLIGNPGCYPTSVILPTVPLLRAGLVKKKNIIVDSSSGVTGAGAKASPNTHFCEIDESMKAYNVARHRHTSEMEQELSKAAGAEVLISFTPHMIPIKRGIFSTIYMNLKDGVTPEDVEQCYAAAYAHEPFVTVLEEGSLPEIKHVAGSNRCAIGFTVDLRLNRLIVCSVIDNTLKGAAGQAIQNMNILFRLPETTGLPKAGLYL